MALKIVWTKRAEAGYDKIINYLEDQFTEKEVRNFVRESRKFFQLLSQHPEILEKSPSKKYVYRGAMNELTILTYRVKPRKKEIELVNIRSSRQRPLKK